MQPAATIAALESRVHELEAALAESNASRRPELDQSVIASMEVRISDLVAALAAAKADRDEHFRWFTSSQSFRTSVEQSNRRLIRAIERFLLEGETTGVRQACMSAVYSAVRPTNDVQMPDEVKRVLERERPTVVPATETETETCHPVVKGAVGFLEKLRAAARDEARAEVKAAPVRYATLDENNESVENGRMQPGKAVTVLGGAIVIEVGGYELTISGDGHVDARLENPAAEADCTYCGQSLE